MQFPPYTTGTVSIADGETTLVFTGGIITDIVARRGDVIYVNNQQPGVEIFERTDNSHCEIAVPWSSGDMVDVPFTIVPNFPARVAGAEAAEDVTRLVAALNTNGLPWLVPSDLSAPDPSWGDEGQAAEQRSTGKQWHKEGGEWVYDGIFKGLGVAAPYDNGKTYSLNDVATSGGSSYVWINSTPGAGHAPPNATYWDVLASRGPVGPGATVEIGTVTTGAPGTSASVENSGTDTEAVLNFTIPRGNPGAGDVSSINYGSEYAGNKALFRDNLAIPPYQKAYYSQDLNDLSDDGDYLANGTTTNAPLPSPYEFYVRVSRYSDANYVLQIANQAYPVGDAEFVRRKVGGVWGPWRRTFGAGVQSKSANYTVVGSDRGSLISCTANMTLAFAAAATLGDGFRVEVENAGSGVSSAALVTLDPNGAETINGQPTLTLAPGEKCTVVCDGAGFRTIGLSGAVILATGSVSNVSQIVLQLPAGFKNAELKLSGISPVSGGAAFQMQVSNNGGSSWATGYERAYGGVDTGNSGGVDSWAKGNGAATFFLTSGLGVDYGGGIAIDLFDYETAALYKMFFVRATYALQSGAYDMRISCGVMNTGMRVNAIRISCTTGNIKSAMYQLIAHRFG